MNEPLERHNEAAPSRERMINLPPMVTALILVNVGIHVLRWLLPADIDDALVTALAFVPLRYLIPDYFSWHALLSPIAHQFLHAGVAHLAINMAFLAAFGAPIERRLGPWRMLAFTLVCGLAAAALHLVVYGRDPVGVIGFSGAGSGLFGAVLALMHNSRRLVLIGGIWIVINAVIGVTGGPLSEDASIAWVAHIGGFIAGVVLIRLFDPVRRGKNL